MRNRRGWVPCGFAKSARCFLAAYYFGALPVPDNGTCCGAPVSSSLMVNSPVCSVVLGGVKVTDILQLFPGSNIVLHALLTANGGVADSPVIDTAIADFLELPFLIVTVLGLLTASTTVDLPKFKDLGEIFNLASTGVGVAVGVAVALAVVVAVAVAVAVAVGVPVVDVAVAVGVAVLVAVAVAVGVPPVAVAVAVAVLVAVAVGVAVLVAVAVAVAVGATVFSL